MYNSSNRQYIFRQSSGKIINFYNDSKEGLCYSILKSRNTWGTPVLISRNAMQSFCAGMDPDDRFHIIFQDKDGNMYYALLSNAPLHTVPILMSKTPTTYDKAPSVLVSGSTIHFFYVLQHDQKFLLSHQTLAGGVVSNPKVIDYVAQGGQAYSTVMDGSGNIFCFYPVSDGDLVQIGYKKYNLINKTWGEFSGVTTGGFDCSHPRALPDMRNVIHILFQRSTAGKFELVYKQKVPGKDQWSREAVIHTSAKPFTEASIAIISKVMTVFWIRGDDIYFSTSEDDGTNWSKPSRYSFYAGRQLFCMVYKSNMAEEHERICSKELPGSFINGFRMGFYQIPAEHPSPNTAEDLKAMIVDSLRMLKDNVDELKEAEDKSRENYMGLNRDIEEIRKELDKYSIRLEMTESLGKAQKNPPANNDLSKNETNELKLKITAFSEKISQVERKLEILEGKVEALVKKNKHDRPANPRPKASPLPEGLDD